MKTGFDERIKEIYDSGEFEYNPANWLLLEDRMNPVRKSKQSWKLLGLLSIVTFKQISAAASVLFAVGLSVTYFNDTPQLSVASAIINEVKPTQIFYQQDDSKILSNSYNNHTIASNSQKSLTISLKGFCLKPSNSFFNLPFSHSISSAKSNINNTENNPALLNGANTSSNDENDVAIIDKQTNEKFKMHDVIVKSNQTSFQSNFQNPNINFPHESINSNNDGLSFVGSIAKGANNSSYSAGVNYQASISNRFFIDGVIALHSSYISEVVMFNSEVENTPLFKATPNNAVAFDNNKKETKVNSVVQNASYAHVAVNPSLGFKLSKRFSAKAGLDVQKRISNTKELGFVESNSELKALPNYDLGFTPKLGINLNEHWQTNIVYRKGINNLVSNKNYFNRDYFQLQLGYKF